MANIRVNFRELEDAAAEISEYISRHRAYMREIGAQIDGLSTSWQGTDYDQLETKWREIDAADSISGRMLAALESYGRLLRDSAEEYKRAQRIAVELARRL